MQRQASPGPGRILGEVTLIMLVPMLGGVVFGLVLDAQAGTSPIFVLGGLVLGSLTSGIGIWLYVRVRRPRPPDTDPGHQP